MRLSKAWTHALLLTLAAGAGACSSGSNHADADGDGRRDGADLCPGTAAGTPVGPDGCGLGDDGDRDGLDSGNDLCPGTPAGAPVDAFGCSADQRAAGAGSSVFSGPGAPRAGANERSGANTTDEANGGSAPPDAAGAATESKGLILHPPATGSILNGYMALVIDRDSSRPFVFHTFASNVTPVDAGYVVHGALLLATPLGELPIANASVTFAYGANKNDGLQTLRGDASVPFPSFGAGAGFSATELVKASVGFDSGKNLAELAAPLDADEKYLFFQLSAGVSLTNGPLTLSLPGGKNASVVLDPFDPFVYASGNLLGMDSLGPLEDVGLGISAQGLIPFSAETTRGVPHGLEDFRGTLYVKGALPLARLPLTLSGEAVLDVDPNADGRPLSAIDAAGFRLGVNGSLELTADFLDVLSFDASLAQASAEVLVTGDQQQAALSGVIEPDHSFLPDELPLRADSSVNVAGLIASDVNESYLAMDGKFHLVGSKLGKAIGVDLSDLAVVDAKLAIAHTGFHLVGKLGAGAKLSSELELGAGAKLDAKFGDDPQDFSVDLRGDLKVAGVPLASGHAHLDGQGLHVDGKVDTGLSSVAVSGDITMHGAKLTGEAGVSIDVTAGKDELEKVTDGALCGYERVQDGALCGFEVVTDGVKCGFEPITDAGRCGYESVTSGALCGYAEVTSAVICGTHWGESAASCGVSKLCDFFGFCSAGSCDIPNTCPDLSQPKTCSDLNKPATCDDVAHPKSCPDPSQPKSCQDLSQPKTCEHHHVIPDYDFGKFDGKVTVTIGTGGLGGSVSGNYCPTGGSCTKLASGRVKVGDPLEACVDVPGGLGEFCAGF